MIRLVLRAVGLGAPLMTLAIAWFPPLAGGVAGETPLKGPHVLGWGFNQPAAVVSDGKHVWVANEGGDIVTELSASTGALVKVLSGSR